MQKCTYIPQGIISMLLPISSCSHPDFRLERPSSFSQNLPLSGIDNITLLTGSWTSTLSTSKWHITSSAQFYRHSYQLLLVSLLLTLVVLVPELLVHVFKYYFWYFIFFSNKHSCTCRGLRNRVDSPADLTFVIPARRKGLHLHPKTWITAQTK